MSHKIYYSASTCGFYNSAVHSEIPSDAVEITKELYLATVGNTPPGKTVAPDLDGLPTLVDSNPAPTPAEIEAAKIKASEIAVQNMLDAEAAKKGYDNIQSASQYAALPVGEPFQAEGAAFLLWRAKCWAKCYAILADVKSGKRAEPTDLVAEMPALLLP